MATRIVATALGWAVAMGLLAPPAVAGAAPDCPAPEAWDRPGLERAHALECFGAERVALATAPAHGSLTGLALDGGTVRWRYRADPAAPAEDRFELRLSGPGGSTV